VALRRGADPAPRSIAFRIGHALDLVEPGDGVANVRGVGQYGSLRSAGKANRSELSLLRSRVTIEMISKCFIANL
jgi:hypothetical protein